MYLAMSHFDTNIVVYNSDFTSHFIHFTLVSTGAHRTFTWSGYRDLSLIFRRAI